VLLTRKGNTVYVHLCNELVSESVKLKPLTLLPRRATLLNTGELVRCDITMAPSDHADQKGYLRLRDLPVNESANTVLVLKLEFDELPTSEAVVLDRRGDVLQR
jgi:alpha-L-fucosidase